MIMKGQKINDRYQIIKTIGEGGMANVYLAYDTILDRNVAVKVLRGDLASDEKFVRRFQREALSVSNLSHQNIVEVYDVGEEDGEYYIRCDLGRNSIIFNSGCKDRRFIVIPNNQVNLTNSDDKVDDMIKKVNYCYSVILFNDNKCHTDDEYYDTLFNWLLNDEYNNDIDGIRPKNIFCSTQLSYLDSFKITNESANIEPISENQLSELDQNQLQMSFI